MRILQLTADWKWTGPAEPMLHLATGLRALGHQVDVAFPTAPPGVKGALAEHAAERGFEPVLRLARRRGYGPLRDRDEVERLAVLLEAASYDVVHAHHTRDHLLARSARRRPRVRARPALVASWHRGVEVPATLWNRWLLGPRGADGLVVLSERIAAAASRRLRRRPETLCVVPGVVDTERFRPRAASARVRDELGIREAECAIGVVARLQPHRRFDLLLEGFRRAVARVPALRLVVVGRGTRASEVLSEPVRRLRLEGRVVPAGYRRGDFRDVLSLFRALVFLVPGSDGSCRAVLETMAMGIPTLASRRELLPEIVRDGETGRLVAETPEALAEALIDVAERPAVWARRGEAARVRACEHFAIPRAALRLAPLYEALRGSSTRCSSTSSR